MEKHHGFGSKSLHVSKGQQKCSFAGGGTLIGRRFHVKDPYQLLPAVDGDSQGWKLKVVTWSLSVGLKMLWRSA